MVAEPQVSTQIPTLSATRLSQYLSCPYGYKLKYIDRVEQRTSRAMYLGSAVHDVIRTAHENKWGPDDMQLAADAMAEQWAEHEGDPEYDKAAREAAQVWLPWYLDWAAGHFNIAVEEKFLLPIPGTDLELTGYMDRVYRAAGETVVSDVKTGKRAPSANDLATDLQLSLYSWAFREMSSQNREDALEIVQIRSRKTLRTYRTDEYLDHVIAAVVVPTARSIEAGLFPANPSSKYGCGYCEFNASCPVGQGCQ